MVLVLGQAYIHHQGPAQVRMAGRMQARKRACMLGHVLGLGPGRVGLRRAQVPGLMLGLGLVRGWAAAKGMARPEGVAVVRHMAEVPMREAAPEEAKPPVKSKGTIRHMAEATTIEKTSPKDDKINVTMRS